MWGVFTRRDLAKETDANVFHTKEAEMRCIGYKGGYKYQLQYDFTIKTGIEPRTSYDQRYLRLDEQGTLTIKAGYAWDGPSGPAFDTLNFMRGSLVHDALYQLMRERVLDRELSKDPADRLLQAICREDGMSWVRAWWVYLGVKYFGKPATDPANEKECTWVPTDRSDACPCPRLSEYQQSCARLMFEQETAVGLVVVE